jgi:hypothetical protein
MIAWHPRFGFSHNPRLTRKSYIVPVCVAVQQHYCIVVGIKDRTGLLDRFGLPHYAAQPFVPPAVPAALHLPLRFTT